VLCRTASFSNGLTLLWASVCQFRSGDIEHFLNLIFHFIACLLVAICGCRWRRHDKVLCVIRCDQYIWLPRYLFRQYYQVSCRPFYMPATLNRLCFLLQHITRNDTGVYISGWLIMLYYCKSLAGCNAFQGRQRIAKMSLCCEEILSFVIFAALDLRHATTCRSETNLARQSKMPISVTINRSNRNRKYNSNMAEVCFLKSEVVITQLGSNYLIEIWFRERREHC